MSFQSCWDIWEQMRSETKKGQSSAPAPKAQTQTDGKKPSNVEASEEKDCVPKFPEEKVHESVM